MTTRSLIRNPVAIMRCAGKGSENRPRYLISHRSCIWYTTVPKNLAVRSLNAQSRRWKYRSSFPWPPFQG